MPDESGDAAYIRVGAYDRNAESAGAACVACSLVAVGAMAAVFGTPHTRSIRETHFRYARLPTCINTSMSTTENQLMPGAFERNANRT